MALRRVPILGALWGASAVCIACTSVPSFSAAPAADAGALPHDGALLIDGALPDDSGGSDAGGVPDGSVGDAALVQPMLFMTAAGTFGNLGTGNPTAWADAFCATAAAAKIPPLTGKWVALLWTNAGGVPFLRVTPSSTGWFQVSAAGTPGAQVLTALSNTGRTANPILTQFGQELPGTSVWTGGDESSVNMNLNCGNWGDSNKQAILGDPNSPAKSPNWLLARTSVECGKVNPLPHIYCIQTLP